MVEGGISVNVCKSDSSKGTGFEMDGRAVEVSYEARVINHNGTTASMYRPGIITALGAGVAVLYGINYPMNDGERTASVLGAAGALDYVAGAFPSSTNTEIVVTTTIAENNKFIFRSSDIYYIPDADASLFFKRVKQKSSCQEDKALVTEADKFLAEADKEEYRKIDFLRNQWRAQH
jgi:hypothetical protein